MPPTKDTLVTPQEAVRVFKDHGYDLTARSIRRMCQSGKFAGARKVGKPWYIKLKTIMELMGE